MSATLYLVMNKVKLMRDGKWVGLVKPEFTGALPGGGWIWKELGITPIGLNRPSWEQELRHAYSASTL